MPSDGVPTRRGKLGGQRVEGTGSEWELVESWVLRARVQGKKIWVKRNQQKGREASLSRGRKRCKWSTRKFKPGKLSRNGIRVGNQHRYSNVPCATVWTFQLLQMPFLPLGHPLK